jgi:sulfate adenylyltransferase subunit 1
MSDLLRLATAGSVDDGKSTLVGRLLYDTKSVLADQYDAIERASRDRGLETADLALLTDGLRAEREQGITIDVAYRYFSTPARSFVLADTPGHVQYTRNMVTGASTAELAIILVDARKGILEQTRRHAAVSALLGVPHLVLAVNKMDLVDFDPDVFHRIEADFAALGADLGVPDAVAIPVSALAGDNIVDRSERTPWYDGPTLLQHLEEVPVERDPATEALRFGVQYVIRPRTAEHPDYRGYAGRVASGIVTVGDEVIVQPAGSSAVVTAIDTFDGPRQSATAGESVTLLLDRDLDIARGDLIASAAEPATVVRDLSATVCWLAETPSSNGARLLLSTGSRTVRALLSEVTGRLDLDRIAEEPADRLALNDLGRVTLRLAEPIAVDDYSEHRHTGAFLLIDEADGTTLAAGMVRRG